MPLAESELVCPLVLVIADGWNTITPSYFEFRRRLEGCQMVGALLNLRLPGIGLARGHHGSRRRPESKPPRG